MTDADKQDERSTIPGTLIDHRVCLSNHAPIPPLFLQVEHLISFFFKKNNKAYFNPKQQQLDPDRTAITIRSEEKRQEARDASP